MGAELEGTLKSLKRFYLDKHMKQKTEIKTIIAQGFLTFLITVNLILAGYAASVTYHGRKERERMERIYKDIYSYLEVSNPKQCVKVN